MMKLWPKAIKLRHTSAHASMVYEVGNSLISVWAATKTEVPSAVMVDNIAQAIIPELTNGMYVLGSCFHRCDQMMPSITMNSPRLSVVQNGPMTVRR